jgi:hypothetical protein
MIGTTMIVVTTLVPSMPTIMSNQIRGRLYHFLKLQKITQINLSFLVIHANLVAVTGTSIMFRWIFDSDTSSLY